MKKIIAINGAKNSKKDYVAIKLLRYIKHYISEDVEYIKPYTEKKELSIAEFFGMYHRVSSEDMDIMLETGDVLTVRSINGNRWAYFKSQINANYSILILDDCGVCDLLDNKKLYDLITVRVKSENEDNSDRSGKCLYDHEFDIVFDSDNDDIEDLKEWL